MAREKINEDLILKAATLYYSHGLTQEKIARKMGFSRPSVVRMLKQARDLGMVEIRITRELPKTVQLETRIETILQDSNLREVIVVESHDDEPQQAVARRAAEYLAQKLTVKDILGIGWSSTLMNVPDYLWPRAAQPQRVVQLGGYVGGISSANAQDITQRIGHILNVPVEPLPAPVILKSREVRDSLLEDPSIKNTLAWVGKCTIGLVGIGDVSAESTLVKAGYITAEERRLITEAGAVGDIQSHHYNIEGREITTPWQDRMISVDLDQLTRMENLVGAAAGASKARSLLGAIRSDILNTVIIDMPLARALLKLIR